MEDAITNGNQSARRTDCDEVTDQRVLVRALEMRGQGYSFGDIAAALAKQGLVRSSPGRIRDILEAHKIQQPPPN